MQRGPPRAGRLDAPRDGRPVRDRNRRRSELPFDIRRGAVMIDGMPVELTAQELAVLSYLVHHAGRLISRTELSEHIYEYDGDRDSNTIAVFVTRLRKKLGHDFIETIRGRGYRIAAD